MGDWSECPICYIMLSRLSRIPTVPEGDWVRMSDLLHHAIKDVYSEFADRNSRSASDAIHLHWDDCREAYAFGPRSMFGSSNLSCHSWALCKNDLVVHCISYFTRSNSSSHLCFCDRARIQ